MAAIVTETSNMHSSGRYLVSVQYLERNELTLFLMPQS